MTATFLAIALLVALPQGDASTATASLEGYVRDAVSHAPIPNAFVVLSAAGVRTATASDSEGRFAFADLAPGRYNLAAVAAPDTPPAQLPPDVMTAAVNGNRFTKHVDVHDASVNGVTVVFRGAP